MSSSFLAAVELRALDCATLAQPAPANPVDQWRGGILEKESFFQATSKLAGCQALVMSAYGDTFYTRAYEGDDEKVGVYSVNRGALRPLTGHTDMVSALSLDGDRLASGGTDGSVRIWEVSSDTCFARADVGEVVHSVCLAGNFLAAGDAANRSTLWRLGATEEDGLGRVWKGYRRNDDDRNEDEIIAVEVPLPRVGTVAHRGTVYGVVVTPGGVGCSVGWNQKDLKVWDAAGSVLHEIEIPAAAGFALALQGETIYVGLRSGHVATYSLATGAMGRIFPANSAKREVSCLAVCGPLLVAGCELGTQAIRVLSLAQTADEGREVKPELVTMHDPLHSVAAIALGPNASLILTTGADEELEVWEPANPTAPAGPVRTGPWMSGTVPSTPYNVVDVSDWGDHRIGPC